jgi:NAD-dependent SIR2 family protein deacetylase
MHGTLGSAEWAAPRCVMSFNAPARSTFTRIEGSEYTDEPEVLRLKVQALANLVRESRACVAFTGAGISTAAGIDDYATKGQGQSVTSNRAQVKDWKDAAPTLSHRVLTGLYRAGRLQHWVQQNHDSLPQKAGYPQHALNEIHGSLHDPSNPIVPYEGTLRDDLYAWLEAWERRADLVLALGTSLSGFNVDRLAETAAERGGLVIVNLQRTQFDALCNLRIFAKLDVVLEMLAVELGVEPSGEYTPTVAPGSLVHEDVFVVPFDSRGRRSEATTQLDLRKGQRLRLTQGPYAGDVGTVVEKRNGSYRLRFLDSVNPTFQVKRAPFSLWLGPWWLEELTHGRLSPGALAPLANTGEQVDVPEKQAAPAPAVRAVWKQTDRGWRRE